MEIALLAARVAAGGLLVVAFAVVSDMLRPKMFAGLFSAAPSVATASLLITGLASGPARDHRYALGMVVGAVGLVFFSAAAAVLVKRLGAVAGSTLAWAAWAAPSFVLWWVFLR